MTVGSLSTAIFKTLNNFLDYSTESWMGHVITDGRSSPPLLTEGLFLSFFVFNVPQQGWFLLLTILSCVVLHLQFGWSGYSVTIATSPVPRVHALSW